MCHALVLRRRLVLLATAAWVPFLFAQTTQALLSGRVTDSVDGSAVSSPEIDFESQDGVEAGSSRGSPGGDYVLSSLAPGLYRIRVRATGYQPREIYNVNLPLASFLILNIQLRPLTDLWDQGQFRDVESKSGRSVLTFFGPDVDPTRSAFVSPFPASSGSREATTSDVIFRRELDNLPLAGHDAYSLVALQPAVAADTGTARGLGLSVNGQRPSSSNFLLDGVENNNYLAGGPLTLIAPEALGEYRISSNYFSAEFGGSSGYLANAISRAGANTWRGLGYLYFENEALDANGFQENAAGIARRPEKRWQPGVVISGPLRRNRTFASLSLERLQRRALADPQSFALPSSAFHTYTASGSLARKLLDTYTGPLAEAGVLPTAIVSLAPPVSLDQSLALARMDHHWAGGRNRLMARLIRSTFTRPDFIWTPYPDFVSELRQADQGLAFGWISAIGPRSTIEARTGVSSDELRWNRPHPEIPTLAAEDGVVLPGSPAFYAFRIRTRSREFNVHIQDIRGNHVLKAGAAFLDRRIDGGLTAGRDGLYVFQDMLSFGADTPKLFEAAVRRNNSLATPEYERHYRNFQFSAFGEDTWKVSARIVLNAGIRYENFGSPANIGGTRDTLLELGSGASLPGRIASARFVSPGAGKDQLYASDDNNFAARAGLSWELPSKSLLKAAFGTFYDRPLDNWWQNIRSNSWLLALANLPGVRANYLQPTENALSQYRALLEPAGFPEPLVYQPALRDGYVHNYFLGLEQPFGSDTSLQINAFGSLSRKLITTDRINRSDSVPVTFDNFIDNPYGRFNPDLPTLAYRANQGAGSYHALSVVWRRRSTSLDLRAAYTWSHSIDNQSEPLAGDFFDLVFTRLNFSQDRSGIAAFSRQFDSHGDRANSDFDQRHNLVLTTVWQPRLPASGRFATLARGWTLSQVSAFRSGLPFSALAPAESELAGDLIYNRRADLIDASRSAIDLPAPGGRRLLDPEAFGRPPADRQGTSGRNEFRGPGLYHVDLSVGRSFALPGGVESRRITFRVDAFNLLNHANLNNPANDIGAADFGVARSGRTDSGNGFPALIPLDETARRIQLLLRFEF